MNSKLLQKIFFLSSLLLPAFSFAQSNVNFTNIYVSNPSPNPGSTVGVTVVYCQLGTYIVPYFYVGLNPSQTTLQSCPTANQVLLVDKNTTPTGTSPVNATQNDANDGGGGWAGVGWNGTAACPTTQIWNVTIPASQAPGPVNLIVQEKDYYIGCDGGSYANISTVLNIPLPAAAVTLTKRVDGSTAAPNGLILFSLDYSFVNTNNFIITDPLPANTTFVTASNGGGSNGSAVTWNMGNATTTKSGTVWFLASINSGTPNGTLIVNQASGSTNELGSQNSNSVTATVQVPALTLTKSQSASSLSAGATITYNLDFTATGQNLQIFDSYANIGAGANVNAGGATVGWGYDGTSYTDILGPGPGVDPGSWTIRSDTSNDHFIEAKVTYNSGGGSGNYPELLRSVPGADICNSVIVQGDLQIPATASGASSGADAHMVVACNPSQGITLKAGISIDNSPGNLFVQKNNIYPLQSPTASKVFSTPFAVSAGQWYTMRSTVQATGTGTTNFTILLWPKGTPANAVTLSYTDTYSPQPTCSGGWRSGWQVDETSGTDWFSNLMVFGPGPVVNASVTDVIPTGVSYLGSSITPSSLSPLVWTSPGAFPVTMFAFDTPINWWGTVACPGPISNSFTMAADSVAPVTSNSVTLTVNCSPTPTPSTGCKVLIYFNSGACDGTGGATGSAVTNLVPVLQAAGAQVTTIGVCSNSYCPTSDNWSSYNQVWDARFYGSAQSCGAISTYNDDFSACWQSTAQTYLQNGGNLYLQGENAGYPSRYYGNDAFLRSVGAVSGSYVDCPWGTTSNDYDGLGSAIASTLPGTSQFFGFAVGGIPIALLNGTSFVHDTTWNNSPGTDRSIASGWTAAQMTLGGGAGKLFACWDTTMWTGGYYFGANKTITDTFFTSVYQWMGGGACTSPTPTPTSTPTYTPTQTPTPTPSPTFTITPTPGCCVDGSAIVSTIAGTGVAGYTGDGGPATSATLNWPMASLLDPAGNIYIGDAANHVIRKISTSGIISTFAGTGVSGYSGDGGPATSAKLAESDYLAIDTAGNIYSADRGAANVRKITPGGIISSVVGAAGGGYSGDGGLATAAKINYPMGLVFDGSGNLYIADSGNHVIRKIAAGTGIITTIAGTGVSGYSGDGGAATSAKLANPEGLAYDGTNIYFFDDGNSVIRVVNLTTGIITTMPGSVGLPDSEGLAYCGGKLYVSSYSGNYIWTISGGVRTVIAGNGSAVDGGNGGPALSATFNGPEGLTFGPDGSLYVVDYASRTVRKLTPSCAPVPPTSTPTATPTSTPTITPTPVNTPTDTPTPVGLNIWPNPYNPKYAFNGELRAYQVPPDATLGIYTLSGEQVLPPMSPDGLGWIKWLGVNAKGVPVSSGIYYYIVQQGSTVLLKGKLLILRDP